MASSGERSSFSSASFRVTDWLNGVVSEERAKEGAEGQKQSTQRGLESGLESRLSQLRAQLTARDAELNEALEAGMSDLLALTPRASEDARLLERTAGRLASELDLLVGQLDSAASTEANVFVEMLSSLDTVKRNMISCSDMLGEARAWEAQVRDVRSRLGQGDLAGVVEKFDGLSHSLAVLRGMPGGEERSATLASLRSALEDELKPKVRAALMAENTAALTEFVAMYSKLGKTQSLLSDYIASRALPLHNEWFRYVEIATVDRQPFATWLPTFYKIVRKALRDDRARASEVFGPGEAPLIVASIVVEIFQPLCTAMEELLADPEIVSWQFVPDIYEESLSLCSVALNSAAGAPPDNLLTLMQSITAPFQKLKRGKYGQKEAAHLRRVLKREMDPIRELVTQVPPELTLTPDTAFVPRINELKNGTSAALKAAKGAVTRCLALTAGSQARDLLKALCEVLDGVLGDVSRALHGSRLLCGPLSGEAFDWNFLEAGLNILQWVGDLGNKFEALEKDIAQSLGVARLRLFDPSAQSIDALISSRLEEGSETTDLLRLVDERAVLQENAQSREELMDTLGAVSGAALMGEVLHAPAQRFDALQASTQDLVYDISFAVIRQSLRNYSSLAVWRKKKQGAALSGGMEASSFSYDAPQTCITSAGEHMLSLLQQLEPFAQSRALADAIQASEGVGRLGTAEWTKLGWRLNLSESELELMEAISADNVGLRGMLRWDSDMSGGGFDGNGGAMGGHSGDGDEGQIEDEFDTEAAQFCTIWLKAVGVGAMGAFLAEVVQIQKLSNEGASQLATDTAYLVNVLLALDIPSHALMDHVLKICRAPVGSLGPLLSARASETLSSSSSSKTVEIGGIVRKFEQRLCNSRQQATLSS